MLQFSLLPISLPIGNFLLMEIDGHLCALCSPDQLDFYRLKAQRFLRQALTESDEKSAVLLEVQRQLEEYFAGQRTVFDLPIRLYGTDFQQKVWQRLSSIPYGSTVSYGQIAADLGTKGTRAVGTAVGDNPLPIIVPCHRVLPASGKLGNFSMQGSPASKAFLLDLEKASYQ